MYKITFKNKGELISCKYAASDSELGSIMEYFTWGDEGERLEGPREWDTALVSKENNK